MSKGFKDHFSTGSADYSSYRPTYPPALFKFLASVSPHRSRAWDCATGTGQAAIHLSKHFDHIMATDASEEQIATCPPHSQISYQTSPAENTAFKANSIDLITVAQALHWFDIPAFFVEAKRVLKQNGILAVWTYNLLKIEPSIDRLIDQLYYEHLADYWPPERRLVEQGYASITFPFTPIMHPEFAMAAEWDLQQLLGYLETWSAVKRKRRTTGENAVTQMTADIAAAWAEPTEKRQIRWPLSLKLGSSQA